MAEIGAKPIMRAYVTEPRLKVEQYIGIQIKRERVNQGLKLSDVARVAGISQGMLSKIENAQVSTSLETLNRLCDALHMPMSRLFSQYDQQDRDAVLVKAGGGMEVVRRGTERGHTYHLLNHSRGSKKSIEAYLVTIEDATEEFPTFSHPGTEFIHILEGAIAYRHGNNVYELHPGDSLTFYSDVPHGPERLMTVPIRMLSVMNYHEESL